MKPVDNIDDLVDTIIEADQKKYWKVLQYMDKTLNKCVYSVLANEYQIKAQEMYNQSKKMEVIAKKLKKYNLPDSSYAMDECIASGQLGAAYDTVAVEYLRAVEGEPKWE